MSYNPSRTTTLAHLKRIEELTHSANPALKSDHQANTVCTIIFFEAPVVMRMIGPVPGYATF